MSDGKPLALVAMGGHAFIRDGEAGNVEEHNRNAELIAKLLMTLIERDYDLVITHGNGPQVGNLLIQNELAREQTPAWPLDVLVAMTEGSLGYIVQQSLLNQLRRVGIRRFVVTMVTQVLVDKADPAFLNPNKPIGPFLTREDAERRSKEDGWEIREDAAGRGWRRLVASPRPISVVQRDMIREVARVGHIVVACGGGGIPIYRSESGAYTGVEAVVDKDLTSAVLASNIGAELLIILTSVPNVYINFGKPDQHALSAVTLNEIERLHEEGQFPKGSMGPKVEAAIHFLKGGGKRALITDPDSLPSALAGQAGTHFLGTL